MPRHPLSHPSVVLAVLGLIRLCLGGMSAHAETPALEVTQNLTLDPSRTYGRLIVKRSGITIDGKGAWLIGATAGPSTNFTGTAILLDGVHHVTLRNLNAKGWETGLVLRHAHHCTVENCNLSDNFHAPDFGWGENARRGGILCEDVHHSTIRHCQAHDVWDACALVDSNNNLIEDNDFSRTSNTCLKLWTASRNVIQRNRLTDGIRISPGEVHARDSTCVLIESGSNDNRFLDNDCRRGGDGIFVRVLNHWCSTGNYFEGNDCSEANNNGFECWAPRNVFVRNRANHCSYGFWMGGSDQTRLIGNEASYNGLPTGHHNSPHLPDKGHAGIIFLFGPSSHIVARGNVCQGNQGAGLALVGDLDSKGKKWRAYHWIVEQNVLTENRWGLYAQYADWIALAGNECRRNSARDVWVRDGVTRLVEDATPIPAGSPQPTAILRGPEVVTVGAPAVWNASSSRSSVRGTGLRFEWDCSDGTLSTGPRLRHTFTQTGFQRVGLSVFNGHHRELAWRDVYVVDRHPELGTDGEAAAWGVEDFQDRQRSTAQTSRAAFRNDRNTRLIGRSALGVVVEPYAGFRVAFTYPKQRNARWETHDKRKLVFWLKAINADVTGWQGGPFITLHAAGQAPCHLEPQAGFDPMRELEHNEARDGWRRFEVPLQGDAHWKREGSTPQTVSAISLAFDSWGAPTLRFWLDGLALE